MARRFFTWRSAILKSNLSAGQKLVSLVISTYMNDHGTGAFPSQETIASDASTSVRSVQRSLKVLHADGWLRIAQHGYAGQKWRRNEYEVRFPKNVRKGGDTESGPPEQGGDRSDVKVATQSRTNSPVNSISREATQKTKDELEETRTVREDLQGLVQAKRVNPCQNTRPRVKPNSRPPWELSDDELIVEVSRYGGTSQGKSRDQLVEYLKSKRAKHGY